MSADQYSEPCPLYFNLLPRCQIITLTVAGLRQFNWTRRNVQSIPESTISLVTVGRFLVFTIGSFGFVYFWCVVRMCVCV